VRQSIVGGWWKSKDVESELILANNFRTIRADWMAGLCHTLWVNEKHICLKTSWENSTLKIYSAMIKFLSRGVWVNLDQEGHQHHAFMSKIMNLCVSTRLRTSPVAELPFSCSRKSRADIACLLQLSRIFTDICNRNSLFLWNWNVFIVSSTKTRKLHKTRHIIRGRMDPFQHSVLPTGCPL
jgi:hypothetical protein